MDPENDVAAPVEAQAEEVVTETPETTDETQESAPAAEQTEDKESEELSRNQQRKARQKEARERQERELVEWKAKAKEAEARLAEIQSSAAKKPQEADFDTVEDYQAALSAYAATQALDGRESARLTKEREAHEAKAAEAQKAVQAEIDQAWSEQVADAKGRYADFEKVAFNPSLPISQGVATFVAQMDRGADVAYHLGMNPAEAQRISSLPPARMAYELGRLEAQVSAPKARTATNAPDPVTPVKASGAASRDPSKMTTAEYRAWREGGGTL